MILLRKTRSSTIATATVQPTTMPAIAPPDKLVELELLFEVLMEVEVEVLVAVW